ncbi:MAG: S9 family peptidase [Saprospiraceae bacterium]|nr:S9 family peptidase [Saprospiraceae bacterium]
MIKKITQCLLLSLIPFWSNAQSIFTLDDIMAYPFPNELVVAESSDRIAFAINHIGRRNIYVAEAPNYQIRKITTYDTDSGQELSQVSISADGKWIVFVRGGDFGSNWDDAKPVNPNALPIPEKVSIWCVPFAGGPTFKIDEGISPVISPNSKEIIYIKNNMVFSAKLSDLPNPTKIVDPRGRPADLQWSPDGSKFAFVTFRGDHSFIGLYSDSLHNIEWVNPDFNFDFSPRWSPDGKHLVYVRQSGAGGQPDSILASEPDPYTIVTYDLATSAAKEIWTSPNIMRGSLPTTHGGVNLHWAKNFIVFLSYQDGWPHMYRIDTDGRNLVCLTPGDYMLEYISLTPDRTKILASANTGPDPFDIDRRHILQVDIENADLHLDTKGDGVEWSPYMLQNGDLCYIGADSRQPPVVTIQPGDGRPSNKISNTLVPANFPTKQLVIPQQVIFSAPDGTPIHATLFDANSNVPGPAVIYVHGGPPRQMLLGWHYSSYYSNAYAMNQFLASLGFKVLAVNYRLGIGYGFEFHRPPDGGVRGASEYQDIKAAGDWLAKQTFVTDKIGIYGGSYGGYLTAMALGRNSNLFDVGVDIHGVHDRTINRTLSYLHPDRYERAPDAEQFRKIAWQSSPISSVDTWTSPVLIIHADDDRNVAFSQSTDLVQRLKSKDVEMETLVIVDDTHHFMKFENQKTVNKAAVNFLKRHLN